MCTTHAVQTSLQIKLNTPCQKVCRNDEGAGEGCVKGERGGEGERGREVILNKVPRQTHCLLLPSDDGSPLWLRARHIGSRVPPIQLCI